MTMYEGVILTFIVVGIIIIIVSFLLTRYENFIEEEDRKKVEKSQDELADYDDVKNKILELNEYGEYLKDELDKKHKELLFLYQMIIEKQKELKIQDKDNLPVAHKETLKDKLSSGTSKARVASKSDEKSTSKKESSNSKKINCNKEIIDLSLAGYDVNTIAKKLNIGVGQVEMVLNLYK